MGTMTTSTNHFLLLVYSNFENTQKRTYRLTLFRVEWKPIRSSISHTLDVYLFMIFPFSHSSAIPFNAKSSVCASFKGYKFTHVAHVTTFFSSHTCNTSICSPFQQPHSSSVYLCVHVFEQVVSRQYKLPLKIYTSNY